MSKIFVSKYGGTSITSREDVERIKRITRDDSRRRIIVLSAPAGVTNMLIELSTTKDPALADRIIERYTALDPRADTNALSQELHRRLRKHLQKDAYSASIKGFGEEACARLVAPALGAEFVDPRETLVLSEDFDNPRILPESRERIARLADKRGLLVFPGFYGYTKQGQIITFRRGGSDLTGAYIAEAVDAEVYENFTDRDGVFAANPELVPDAKVIQKLTYEEMRDLAYSGFRILQAEALRPVARAGIPVHIRKTSSYPKEGTWVVYDRESTLEEYPIIGVAYQKGFCSVDVSASGLNDIRGVLSDITAIFSEEEVDIAHTPTGIDDISVVVREDQLDDDKIARIKEQIGDYFERLIEERGSFGIQRGIGCLVVAGKGLREDKSAYLDVGGTLEKANVTARFVHRGPQRRCIIYGIDDSDGERAVKAVYDNHIRG